VTYEQLLDRVIDDGITAARADYANKPDHLRGSVDGFEACRGKTPDQLIDLWQAAGRAGSRWMSMDTSIEDTNYYRCYQLEVEWCLNVLSVGLPKPLLSWLPTARAAMKYAEIA